MILVYVALLNVYRSLSGKKQKVSMCTMFYHAAIVTGTLISGYFALVSKMTENILATGVFMLMNWLVNMIMAYEFLKANYGTRKRTKYSDSLFGQNTNETQFEENFAA
jgi:uncharacterized membrane protein YwaF